MAKFNSAPEDTGAPETSRSVPKWHEGKTPEQIAKIEARNKANKDRRIVARNELIEFIKTYGDENVKKAAAILWAGAVGGKVARAASTARVTAAQFLLSLFPNGVGSEVSEMEVFQNFQYGRAEMRSQIVRAIKQAKDPAERVWVAFDFGTKTYSLKGVGADAPEGWTGYKPATVDGVEIK